MGRHKRMTSRSILGVIVALLVATQPGRATAAPQPEPVGRLDGCGGWFVRFSADGGKLLTADLESARVWDARLLKPLTPPLKHGAKITDTFWTANDSRIVTVGGTEVRFWDAGTGKLNTKITQDADVGPAAVSGDGKLALTATGGNGAALWDVIAGKQMRHFDAIAPLSWANFSDDGDKLLTFNISIPDRGWKDGVIRLRNPQTGRDLIPPISRRFEGSDGYFPCELSPDAKRLVVGSGKGFEVYRIENFKKVSEKANGDEFGVDAGYTQMVHFAPDGNRVIWIADACVQMFRADNGESAGKRMDVLDIAGPQDIDCSRSNHFLLIGGLRDSAGLWQPASGRRVQTFDDRLLSCVALSPDGKYAALGGQYPPSGDHGYTEICKLDARAESQP